jgi:hypothetical protein
MGADGGDAIGRNGFGLAPGIDGEHPRGLEGGAGKVGLAHALEELDLFGFEAVRRGASTCAGETDLRRQVEQ